MLKFVRFWKIIVLDTLGVLLMLAAIVLGPFPGPGGLPLFLIGLGLLSIHHEWAKRYIKSIKKYAYRAGDIVFADNPRLQLFYDITGPLLVALGAYVLLQRSTYWAVGLGIFTAVAGITLVLGNRHRWQHVKRFVRVKQK